MSTLMEPSLAVTYRSTVFWDELDTVGVMHNARYALHIERALIDWYESHGKRWQRDVSLNPDQFHVVREFHIEFLRPVNAPGVMRVDFWVEKLGQTSCVYGFTCSSEDGLTEYARGTRAIVKLDPQTFRPAAWTDFFREAHRRLLRSS